MRFEQKATFPFLLVNFASWELCHPWNCVSRIERLLRIWQFHHDVQNGISSCYPPAKTLCIDTIIVKDLSRFGRDYISVGEYMEQIFPLLGVRLIAINDNYDSDNYKGTTLGIDVVVSNLVNTMYCRDAGKKLRTANQVKWRKGITTASAAPFGYRFDPDKKGAFIIDPPAAKIVRRIFDLAILGLGTREIAMIFYLLGSVLLATAILSYLMQQSQGMEALQMLIGGFAIFMIPQVVGSVVVLLELVAVMLRQVWYI